MGLHTDGTTVKGCQTLSAGGGSLKTGKGRVVLVSVSPGGWAELFTCPWFCQCTKAIEKEHRIGPCPISWEEAVL